MSDNECFYYQDKGPSLGLLCKATATEAVGKTTPAVNNESISTKAIGVSQNSPKPSVTVDEGPDSTIIDITFVTEMYGRLIVNKRPNGKGSNLYIYLPIRLTGGRRRYIHFKARYGSGKLFRRFVVDQMKRFILSWRFPSDAHRWCESNLDGLKSQMESVWRHKLLDLSKKRSISAENESLTARVARRDTTISIPLHGFFLEREVPAIRIRQAYKYKHGTPHLLISFPGAIFTDNKTRRKSMKTKFGHDKQWSKFVEEYVKAAVCEWETLEDARVWFRDNDFVRQINQLWDIKLQKNRQ